MPPTDHQLWTFQITGPEPFFVQIPGNPVLQHQGGMSVSHLLLTNNQATQVEAALVERGYKVVCTAAQQQSEEQQKERRGLLLNESSVFPCSKCPSCYWFDPTRQYDGVCGLVAWPVEMVEASRDAHEAARTSESECPVWSHT